MSVDVKYFYCVKYNEAVQPELSSPRGVGMLVDHRDVGGSWNGTRKKQIDKKIPSIRPLFAFTFETKSTLTTMNRRHFAHLRSCCIPNGLFGRTF